MFILCCLLFSNQYFQGEVKWAEVIMGNGGVMAEYWQL